MFNEHDKARRKPLTGKARQDYYNNYERIFNKNDKTIKEATGQLKKGTT